MKSKLFKFLIAFISTGFLAVLSFYVVVSLYYTEGFSFDTWVNGVYCTGRTVQEVNSELVGMFKTESLTVDSSFFDSEEIRLSDIDFSVDYTDSLENIYMNRSGWNWVSNLFSSSDKKRIYPVISYDHEKLLNQVSKLLIVNEFDSKAHQFSEISYSEDCGYTYYEQLSGEIYQDEIVKLIEKELLDFEDFEILVTEEYLHERPLTEEIIHNREVWNEISSFLETKLYFDMGAEIIPVDAAVLSRFIFWDETKKEFLKTEDGSFLLNNNAQIDFIDALCDSYDTYMKPRDYTTYNGEEKHIELSIYGTRLNRRAEEEYFVNAIANGVKETHIPAYTHEAYCRGLNDIGDTFIEVDLTNQVLYFVKDGELLMTCDIVSGKPTGGNATPEVVGYIVRKSRNTTLRGEGYASFVKYWMPFYKADGLHDASWQSKFGGDRYIRYGSHGCINMQLDDVSQLYEYAEVGMPVIVYK